MYEAPDIGMRVFIYGGGRASLKGQTKNALS